MVAVVIDPVVCQTWLYWVIPECWGVVVMVGIALPVALLCAVGRRSLVRH